MTRAAVALLLAFSCKHDGATTSVPEASVVAVDAQTEAPSEIPQELFDAMRPARDGSSDAEKTVREAFSWELWDAMRALRATAGANPAAAEHVLEGNRRDALAADHPTRAMVQKLAEDVASELHGQRCRAVAATEPRLTRLRNATTIPELPASIGEAARKYYTPLVVEIRALESFLDLKCDGPNQPRVGFARDRRSKKLVLLTLY